MYISLFSGLLGLQCSFEDSIRLAARHGFAGVDVTAAELAAMDEPSALRLRHSMERHGVRPGYISLPPGRIPVPEEQWREATELLPHALGMAQILGFTRSALVLLPFHEILAKEEALDEHVERLNSWLPLLEDHGMVLGLEYVAAPSRRQQYSTHTVWNLGGTLELLDRLQGPCGLMLDTFHWHGAGETVADLLALRPEQVVTVHVNDAPDLALEEQVVTVRALPGATAVINSAGFFGALKQIGYGGPVTCEPMALAIESLGQTKPDAIAATVAAAMKQVMGPFLA